MKEEREGEKQKWGWDPWLWSPKALIFISLYVVLLLVPNDSDSKLIDYLRWAALGWAGLLLLLPVIWIFMNFTPVLIKRVRTAVKNLAPALINKVRTAVMNLTLVLIGKVLGAVGSIKGKVSELKKEGKLVHVCVDCFTMLGTVLLGALAYTLAFENTLSNGFTSAEGWEREAFKYVCIAFVFVLAIDLLFIAKRMDRKNVAGSFLLSETWIARYWKVWFGKGKREKSQSAEKRE